MAHYEEWIKRAKSSLKIPKAFINVTPDTDIFYEEKSIIEIENKKVKTT